MLKKIVLAILLLCLASPSYAEDQSQYSSYASGTTLGNSANPHPNSAGGIQPVPATLPPNYAPNGYMMTTTEASPTTLAQELEVEALPAWAQTSYIFRLRDALAPSGSSLFTGNFASTFSSGINPDYIVMPGDRITVRVWGARSYDDVLFVDLQGNIFLPDVGPVLVAGLKESALLSAIKRRLLAVFPENIDIYANLQSAQPVAIYVAGNVPNPGRYAGGPSDSIMSYIDRAGGILADQGSYRNIKLLRNGRTLEHIDLYDYMLRGELSTIRLQSNDTILVDSLGTSVSAFGQIRHPARYEFVTPSTGKELLTYAIPLNTASHVSVQGVRKGVAMNRYMSLDEFQTFALEDGDDIEFVEDSHSDTIMVSASGAVSGNSRFSILKEVRLKNLLNYIAVDNTIANVDSIYILRKSVAVEQKAILTDSLRRLEQSALTATSSSIDEANIRMREAELIQNFVKRASALEPSGVLVVSPHGQIADVLLEEGDEIVIPRRTEVIHISGEVLIPTTVVWTEGRMLKEYISSAGGLSDRADEDNIFVVGQNGSVALAGAGPIHAGDRILVMPKFDSKNMQLVKDITQVLYQMAVAVGVAIGF